MAPTSIAGTLVQLNAEALAGIVFTQMVNPGTPVVYGAFQTTIDLQSGAPVFGSPESQIACTWPGSWPAATSCPSAAAACSPAARWPTPGGL